MSSRREIPASDGFAAAAAAVLGGLAGGLWLWAGSAGVIFGSGWPAVRLSELPGVALRLPGTLGDPARAWPVRVRPDLPGAVGFYSALALLGLLLTILVRASARWLPHARLHLFADGPTGATWARRGELRVLAAGSPRAAPGAGGTRLVLGRQGRRLLYAEHRHALVAFGPPQSGKSAGLAVPALLEWEGPAVASSIKTDLLGCTERHRRKQGEVLVFDPFGLSGATSHTWSPLHGADRWDRALEVASRMASAGELDQRTVEGGDFWSLAAEQRLAPLLFTAARTGAGMGDVVRWAYGQGGRELERGLEHLLDSAHDELSRGEAQAAYDAVQAFAGQAERTRTSIESTVQTMLRAYRFSSVLRSADGCEITAERLLGSCSTLYLIGDAKASKLLRPIFLALLQEVVDTAYEQATRAGGALPLPLLLCLDEAGNVAPLPNLAEIASTAPSHNIQLVTIFHDLAQARSRYHGQAETVVNSHRARMLLPGVADLETLRYFSSLLGDREARELTRTSGSGGTSRTSARRRVPLVAPEALRQLPDRHAVLLYGRLPPARVRLRTWFDDPRLRRMGGAG